MVRWWQDHAHVFSKAGPFVQVCGSNEILIHEAGSGRKLEYAAHCAPALTIDAPL